MTGRRPYLPRGLIITHNFGTRSLAIPKGLHNSAQGCEGRATLGRRCQIGLNPNGVASALAVVGCNPGGVGWSSKTQTQGSSCLATPGLVMESLRDSRISRHEMWVTISPGVRAGADYPPILGTGVTDLHSPHRAWSQSLLTSAAISCRRCGAPLRYRG